MQFIVSGGTEAFRIIITLCSPEKKLTVCELIHRAAFVCYQATTYPLPGVGYQGDA